MTTRRALLLGSAAVALVAASVSASSMGIMLGKPSIPPAPPITASGVSLNLGFLSGGTQALINYVQMMVSQQASAGNAYPGILNSSGFPEGAPTSDIFGTVSLPVTYSGDWIIDWVGTLGSGGLSALRLDPTPSGVTVVSGGAFVVGSTAFTLNLTGTNGSVRFRALTTPMSQTTIRFLSGRNVSSLTSVRLYRADQAALQASGEIFNPDFINVLTALAPGSIRFLDWMNINTQAASRFAYRPATNAWTFASDFFPTTVWSGTTSGTDTYTLSAPTGWGGLIAGATVQFMMGAANSSTTPTLNVGGSGAKTLSRYDGTTLPVGLLSVGSLQTAVYDDVLDKWLVRVGGLAGMTPIEVQVALCNKIGADFWLNVPMFVDDAYVTAAVAYARDNLTAGLKLYVEYSNEVWNSLFLQTGWISARGVVLGWPIANNRSIYSPYGLRICQIMPLATTAWTTTRSAADLRRIMAFQAYGAAGNTDTYRFQGVDLASYGFNVAPNRPIDFSDALSYANYTEGAQLRSADAAYTNTMTDALTAADDYASGVPAQMSSALDFVDSDVRNGTRNSIAGDQTLNSLLAIYAIWAAKATTYSKEVRLYEGGFQEVALSTSRCTALGFSTTYSAKIATLIAAYKNDARFKQLVLDLYSAWMATTGAKFPSWYALFGGQWAIIPGVLTATPYKSYDAIAQFDA